MHLSSPHRALRCGLTALVATLRRPRPTGTVALVGVLVGLLAAQLLAVGGRPAPLQAAASAAGEPTAEAQDAAAPATAGTAPPETPEPATTEAPTSSSAAPTTTAVPEATPASVVPSPKPGPLPTGIGMWIWSPASTEGGDPKRIVARAVQHGLTHLYVRTGSSWQGFHGGQFLERLLPVAHAAGLRVYGWDFPTLDDVGADVQRGLAAVRFNARGLHKIDGFVPDLETPSEGTNSTPERVHAYMTTLRRAVGSAYPVIVCVPRPSAHLKGWPYAQAIDPASAVAPMVYWLNRQPDSDVMGAVRTLRQHGKPIIPVGQAYDGGPEGGRPGPPSSDEILRFIRTSKNLRATGVSFWSWQHAAPHVWSAIRNTSAYDGVPATEVGLPRPTMMGLQRLLARFGYPAPVTGRWDPATAEAMRGFQRSRRIEATGTLDARTLEVLAALGHPLEPSR
jgi:hypothetical protein